MKKILIAAGIVGTAAAGVALYMRRRNSTSKALHKLADEAGEVHNNVHRYFRKNKMSAKRDMEDAIV